MASYSYKELCCQIPERINKAFVNEFKREPDGDPGYNGDCWTLAAMYVEDLTKQRDELLAALELALGSHGQLLLSDPPQDKWRFNRVDEIGRAAIAKVKGGAA